MRKETIAIRGQIERSQYNEHAVPLYLTSSYIFELENNDSYSKYRKIGAFFLLIKT